MIRLFLFLILLASAGAALADWQLLSRNGESALYIDPLTVERGTRPHVWVLLDYGKPDEYQDASARMLLESNCYDRTLRIRSAVYYKEPMARGDTTSEYRPTPWETPAEGTYQADALFFLCGKTP